MFKKQGTSKRSGSKSSCDIKPGFGEATPTDMGSQASACDMGWASEELEHCEELSEVQLATVVGGKNLPPGEEFPLDIEFPLTGPDGQWAPGSFWWIRKA